MSFKYFMYSRKSSESEDRQVQSIQSQIDELDLVVKRLNLNVVEVLFESASAKKPGRKVFDLMVKRIQKGEANGIIVWNPDRLSRNSVDAGQLIYLLDIGVLEEIVTPYQNFKNTPNDKFLLSILWGQAKLDNDNKGLNVKRGMKSKAQKGWYPAPAPLGYTNVYSKQLGFSTIKVDPKKFKYLKSLWMEILMGKYPADVWRSANDNWLNTNKTPLLSHSSFYKLLNSPFYYGEFEFPLRSGNWYKGKHKPMISRDQYDSVQSLLGDKGKPRLRTLYFSYKGIIKCAECGCSIVASNKVKHVAKINGDREYIYYHCSKKSLKHKCLQRPINKPDMEDQFSEYMGDIKIPKNLVTWSKKWNEYLDANETIDFSDIKKAHEEFLSDIKKQRKDLLKLKLSGAITLEQFNDQHRDFDVEEENKIDEFNKLMVSPVSKSKEINDDLEFALEAERKYKIARKEVKRTMVKNLGSNFLLEDKKVRIQLKNSFSAIKQMHEGLLEEKGRFELMNNADIWAKRPDLIPENPSWLPG